MSKRTDLFREAHKNVRSGTELAAWFAEHATEDCVFYAPAAATGEIRGRDAVVDVIQQFVSHTQPQYRIDELMEHSNLVVGFMTVESGGSTASTCQVWRFDGDRVSGFWAVRG